MSSVDYRYMQIIEDILNRGRIIQSRNSETMKLDTITAKFHDTPLISVRRTAWKQALREMEWFLSGSNNIKDLHPSVAHWWTPWADKLGFISNNYGKQFSAFHGSNRDSINQIEYLLDNLVMDPSSRRSVITTWNTADMANPETPITNCHGTMIQCHVYEKNLCMTMYQRSADMMLGVPHNWIQYWALLHYLAHQSGLKPYRFIWVGGDCHIYKSHYEAAERVVNSGYAEKHTPELIYNPTSDSFKADDFSLDSEYKPLIKEKLELIV